jgi:hypothetical protein
LRLHHPEVPSDPPAAPRKPGEVEPAGPRSDPAAAPTLDPAAIVRTDRTGTPKSFPFAARARASPYYPALVHPVLRRVLAAPLGTALGGPIVAALGARGTLLTSAVATIVLGLVATAVLVLRRARHLAALGE